MTVCFAYNLAMPESEGTLDVIDRIVRAASDAAAHRDSAREHTTAALAVNERLITRSGEAIACSRERLAGAPLSTARQMEFRHLKIAEVHVGLARILIRRQRNLIDRLAPAAFQRIWPRWCSIRCRSRWPRWKAIEPTCASAPASATLSSEWRRWKPAPTTRIKPFSAQVDASWPGLSRPSTSSTCATSRLLGYYAGCA